MQFPGPWSRFAFFFLLASVAIILAMLWFLHHLPAPPKGRPMRAAQPTATP